MAMNGVETNCYIRGQQVRNLDLCDVSVSEEAGMGRCNFDDFEAPRLITFSINASKTQSGDIVRYTYMGRHINVEECGTRALSYYMVAGYSPHLYEIVEQRELPDFTDRKQFHSFPLFVREASNGKTCMSYERHRNIVHAMNSILGK